MRQARSVPRSMTTGTAAWALSRGPTKSTAVAFVARLVTASVVAASKLSETEPLEELDELDELAKAGESLAMGCDRSV